MLTFKLHPRNIKLNTQLSIFGFLITIGIAAVNSLFSLYLAEYYLLTKSQIGLFLTISNIVTLFFSFFIGKIIEKFHESKTLTYSLVLISIAYLGIYLNQNLALLLLIAIICNLLLLLRTHSFSILFRDVAPKEEFEKDEGLWGSLRNVSYFIGPLIGGFVITVYPVENIFLFGITFLLLGLIMYKTLDIKDDNSHNKSKVKNINSLKNIKDFFQNKFYLKLYLATSGVNVWAAFLYVYVSILMLENGYYKTIVGFFLAIITIPLILGEYHIDKVIKKIGFRKTYIIAYLLFTISALTAFLVDNYNLKLLALIIGCIGQALLEPTSEIYFFENTSKSEEEKYYSIYYTSFNIGSIIAKVSFAIFFAYIAITNYAYFLLTLIMAIYLSFSFTLKEHKTK